RGVCPQAMQGLHLAHINGMSELFINSLREHYDKLEDFRLFRFKDGFFLVADPDFFDRVMPAKLEHSKYFRRFDQTEEAMMQLGISSVAELNDVIARGELP